MASLAVAAMAAANPPIRTNEQVEFFPSIGRHVKGGTDWNLEIHGWIFEVEKRPVLAPLFRKALGIDLVELSEDERATMLERARLFLTDNKGKRKLAIRIGDTNVTLHATLPNGHVHEELKVTDADVKRWRESAGGREFVNFRTVPGEGDDRVFAGQVTLMEDKGLSVISDIDDTIKITEVRNHHEMFRNTFCRPFRPVPGMASLYQSWASNAPTEFHYVSASPWQLFGPMAEFTRVSGFPEGTFHLKTFRWKDESFITLFESPYLYKRSVIEPLMRTFPDRQFVLVGDSGEKDPEAYGEIARRHRGQVLHIYIHNVTKEGPEAPRYRQAFKELPADLWQVFTEPSEVGKP